MTAGPSHNITWCQIIHIPLCSADTPCYTGGYGPWTRWYIYRYYYVIYKYYLYDTTGAQLYYTFVTETHDLMCLDLCIFIACSSSSSYKSCSRSRISCYIGVSRLLNLQGIEPQYILPYFFHLPLLVIIIIYQCWLCGYTVIGLGFELICSKKIMHELCS